MVSKGRPSAVEDDYLWILLEKKSPDFMLSK